MNQKPLAILPAWKVSIYLFRKIVNPYAQSLIILAVLFSFSNTGCANIAFYSVHAIARVVDAPGNKRQAFESMHKAVNDEAALSKVKDLFPENVKDWRRKEIFSIEGSTGFLIIYQRPDPNPSATAEALVRLGAEAEQQFLRTLAKEHPSESPESLIRMSGEIKQGLARRIEEADRVVNRIRLAFPLYFEYELTNKPIGHWVKKAPGKRLKGQYIPNDYHFDTYPEWETLSKAFYASGEGTVYNDAKLLRQDLGIRMLGIEGYKTYKASRETRVVIAFSLFHSDLRNPIHPLQISPVYSDKFNAYVFHKEIPEPQTILNWSIHPGQRDPSFPDYNPVINMFRGLQQLDGYLWWSKLPTKITLNGAYLEGPGNDLVLLSGTSESRNSFLEAFDLPSRVPQLSRAFD